jgi:hypothetical protein
MIMRISQNYCIKVLTTGLIVLVLISLPLFWARWFCMSLLGDIMPMEYRTVDITTSALVPSEIENDPNLVRYYEVHSHIIHPEASQVLGIADYFSEKAFKGYYSRINYFDNEGTYSTWIYFDKSAGQINCRRPDAEKMPDGTLTKKEIQSFIGPEGVSEIPDNKLGRFTSPVVDASEIDRGQLILYDNKLRQFFAVKFHNKVELNKGPQLSKDDPRRPVDIGILSKNPSILDLYWMPPTIKISENDQYGRPYSGSIHSPIRETDADYRPDKYLLVLDESGRIDLLDKETLEFAGLAGRLPAPNTLFPTDEVVTPDDLLAYRVLPVALKEDHKYRGLFAAAVNREGTALALAIFNDKGNCIKSEDTRGRNGRRGSVPSSRAVLFSFPGAPAITIGKFVLENLQPPILSLASYFTAWSLEAGSGHRALFLLPNSFIAMKGRDARENIATKFLYALLLISPSIALAIILALRIDKDAAIVGLSQKIRRRWIIGTVAFGLPAYMTYRLTRPKITLVTCANCGKSRRPDMDICHRCGSKWDVPELIPPAWRVLNGAE